MSIRTRVLAIVLIPSAALLITGVSVTASLISDGLSARDFADNFVQGNGPIVQTTAALYQERTLSLQAVGGDRQARAGLRAQWNATNAAISQLVKVANAAQALNAQAVSGSTNVLPKLIEELPVMRHNVQAGRVAAAEVDDYYTQFANNGSSAFLQSAIAMPSTTAAVNEVTVLDMNMALNQHSRVVGLGSGWATHGVVPQSDRQQLAQLTGAYQNQLQSVIPRLPASGQAAYGALTAGSAWRLATSGESDLALHGTLAVPLGTWLTAENTVSTDLLVVWGTEMHDTEASAVDAANQTVNRSILVGSLVLALSIAAFVAALLLANGLVRRLRRLRATTLELADVNLPSMIRRIGDGEPVDPESETALRGYGSDEIGQVAEAFNSAQLTAVRAAVAEARTRGGISKVFLDIAHRSQLVVHRQLELLDVAEAKQSDPEHLELLFQLDHLATRARRNAENLLILGGGQPGRRWRRPAALEDIVRSAVSETEHFARVRTVRLPDVQVQGAVVGDLIHLLAELVDNATAFSPPDAAVTVSGNLVGKGVVVEIEDQGLGIEFAERERLNQTLADPPDFQAMALSGQRHLGLFVVGQLAQRHGIAVSLLESAYGGTKAIVLIPSIVIEAAGTAGGEPPAATRSGWHHEARSAPATVAPAPVPQPRGRDDTDLRRRSAEPPRAAPLPPSSSWPDSRAAAASPVRWDTPASPQEPVPGPTGRSRAALPRRERMANLAPGLRPEAETDGTADPVAPRRPRRSPEAARGSMSAFQRGTRQGRDSGGQDNQ